MFLMYIKNKRIDSALVERDRLRVSAAEDDRFVDARVEVLVDTSAFRILEIKASLGRAIDAECEKAVPAFRRLVGLELGRGVTRKVLSAVPATERCTILTQLFLNCCYAALGESSYMLRESVSAGRLSMEEFPKHLLTEEGNRYINSCMALTENGPVVAGLGVALPARPSGDAGVVWPARNSVLGHYVGRYTIVGISRPRDDLLTSFASMDDMVQGMSVDLEVSLPDLVIRTAKGIMRRSAYQECTLGADRLSSLVGLKIDNGLRRALHERMGATKGCVHMANLVLDSCQAFVQALLTAEFLDQQKVDSSPDWDAARRSWMEKLPFLKNACITCAESSPIVRRLGVSWAGACGDSRGSHELAVFPAG